MAIKARPAKRLLTVASYIAPELRPAMQRSLIRLGYAIVNSRLNLAAGGCLNYGYAALDGEASADWENPKDATGRALYARVAGASSLRSKEVLEVGCGRGGGAAFLTERFGPARLTGLDFSQRAIDFAGARYADPRLIFLRGDAEDLPFADASFDVVLNVESSHCYPSMPRFVRETFRVLRSGGHLLFADLRPRAEIDTMRRSFLDAGLEILEEERITANVVRALELDSPRRKEAVRRRIPRPLRSYALNFAATTGSQVYEALRGGDLEYLRFALVKPAA